MSLDDKFDEFIDQMMANSKSLSDLLTVEVTELQLLCDSDLQRRAAEEEVLSPDTQSLTEACEEFFTAGMPEEGDW